MSEPLRSAVVQAIRDGWLEPCESNDPHEPHEWNWVTDDHPPATGLKCPGRAPELDPWQIRLIAAWKRGGRVMLAGGRRQGRRALQRLLEDIHGSV